MTQRTDTLKLGLFLRATGHHIAAWRDSGSQADAGIRLDHYIDLARKAEAAGFDTLFLADNVSVRGIDAPTFDRVIAPSLSFEPLTLLAALATVTSRIGLVATASTSYSEPFNLARQFASLDQISGGRVGWNLVTSSDPDAAKNFGGSSQGNRQPMPIATAGLESFIKWSTNCGTAGRTTRCCWTRKKACFWIETNCTSPITGANTSMSAGH